MTDGRIEQLGELLIRNGPALVLTGAGCSTRSGIPDYRNREGEWKHKPPVLFDDFVRHKRTRQRYWAGSMNGWPRFERARPNPGHHGLARLERHGYVDTLITQNVDGLHRQAGSRNVIDLHGSLATVTCLHCSARFPRQAIQQDLTETNGEFVQETAGAAPDGDALMRQRDYSTFREPRCVDCGGILKPDVVFFGEAIPASRVAAAMKALNSAGCLLVAGSSLMVYSGYRYCREAVRRGLPLVVINHGKTRADDILNMKIDGECGAMLADLAGLLAHPATERKLA